MQLFQLLQNTSWITVLFVSDISVSWKEPSHSAIQYIYQIKCYFIESEQNNFLLIYKLATCFGLSSHYQANSQIILELHLVDVHIVGSQILDPTMCTSTEYKLCNSRGQNRNTAGMCYGMVLIYYIHCTVVSFCLDPEY
jgi:hypothetical protein